MENKDLKSWKKKVIVVGAIIGAIIGVIASRMLLAEAEETDNRQALTTQKGVKIGMLILGLLRQITNL
jgi:hypothetical protein